MSFEYAVACEGVDGAERWSQPWRGFCCQEADDWDS